jgi:hypothetical protein
MSLSKRVFAVVVASAICCLSVACVGFRGPADIKRDVERRTESDLDREFGISIYPASMVFVRWAMRNSDDDEGFSLRGVKKVQVGVYVRDDGGVRLDRHLEPTDFPGLIPMVEVDDAGERVLVMAEMRDERIRRMIVVVDDLDEVVIVRIKGNLDDTVEDTIRMALDQGDHEDLADETVEAWREAERSAEDDELEA